MPNHHHTVETLKEMFYPLEWALEVQEADYDGFKWFSLLEEALDKGWENPRFVPNPSGDYSLGGANEPGWKVSKFFEDENLTAEISCYMSDTNGKYNTEFRFSFDFYGCDTNTVEAIPTPEEIKNIMQDRKS